MSLSLTITVPPPAWPAISHLKFTVIRGLRGAKGRSGPSVEPRPSATPPARRDETTIFMLLNDAKKGRADKIIVEKIYSVLKIAYDFASGLLFV